jgi:hypothetical protein
MPQTDFLPTKQSDLAGWARVFSQRVSQDPASLGVLPDDAALLAARVSEFRAALAIAIRTETRTRVTVTTKDDARERMTETIRAVARIIRANPDVGESTRVALQMIGGASPHPRGRILKARPVVNIMRLEPGALVVLLRDELTPMRRAKPVDVAGAIFFTHVADKDDASTPPIEQWRFAGLACRHEFRIPYSQSDAGKRATIKAAWYTRTGEIGFYSHPVTAMIAA